MYIADLCLMVHEIQGYVGSMVLWGKGSTVAMADLDGWRHACTCSGEGDTFT